MNKLLIDKFQQLDLSNKEKLFKKIKYSDKINKLLNFIEKNGTRNFNSLEAVKYIYEKELEDVSITVLQNRYFKLRKKTLDELDSLNENTSFKNINKEEDALYYCKNLVRKNDHTTAVKEFHALAKECWKKNIFELLPDIYHSLSYCNQVLNDHAENNKIFKLFKNGNFLVNELRKQQLLSKQAYHFCVTKGFPATRNYLYKMRQIADRNSEYPRFKLNYHFSSFTLGIISFGNKLHASARHFNELQKLRNKNPDIPILNFEPEHKMTTEYYLQISKASFEYFRGDLEQSHEAMIKSWGIMEGNPILKKRKSENHYRNKMHIEIACEKFKEAVKTCHELLEYQREQKKYDNQLLAYAEMAQVYVYSYPLKIIDNPEFLLEKLNLFLNKLKRKDPQRLLGEIYTLKASMLFVLKRYDEALNTFKIKSCKKFCESIGLSLFNDFFLLPFEKSEKKINQLKHNIHKELFKNPTYKIQSELKWMLKMVDYVKFNMQ